MATALPRTVSAQEISNQASQRVLAGRVRLALVRHVHVIAADAGQVHITATARCHTGPTGGHLPVTVGQFVRHGRATLTPAHLSQLGSAQPNKISSHAAITVRDVTANLSWSIHLRSLLLLTVPLTAERLGPHGPVRTTPTINTSSVPPAGQSLRYGTARNESLRLPCLPLPRRRNQRVELLRPKLWMCPSRRRTSPQPSGGGCDGHAARQATGPTTQPSWRSPARQAHPTSLGSYERYQLGASIGPLRSRHLATGVRHRGSQHLLQRSEHPRVRQVMRR